MRDLGEGLGDEGGTLTFNKTLTSLKTHTIFRNSLLFLTSHRTLALSTLVTPLAPVRGVDQGPVDLRLWVPEDLESGHKNDVGRSCT